jgi:glycosyltransferase involved in cell wall biosynthesis
VRILLDYRPALRERTGVGEYVHELARALAAGAPAGGERPDAITLFSSSWKDRLTPRDVGPVTYVDRRIPVRLLNWAWHRLEWPPVERLTGQVFDVVHSPHPLLLPSARAAQVVTVHDLDFLAHPERTRAEIRRDYPTLAGRHIRRADHVVVNSRHTAGEVARVFDVPPERLTVCAPGAPAWAPRHPADVGRYLLFVGTLEPRKNVGALLDAYAELATRRPDLPPLVLAGRSTPEAAPWLARLAERPLAGRVEAVGYVAPERRRDLYAQAIVLVIPSWHEGFGLPALEAMTVGVPVVASARGALPEVVGDAGLLVEPEAGAIAGALRRVLDDRAFAERLVARGFERARQFTWRAAAAALREAYAQAVAFRRSRRDV